jgi:hypothetical protein
MLRFPVRVDADDTPEVLHVSKVRVTNPTGSMGRGTSRVGGPRRDPLILLFETRRQRRVTHPIGALVGRAGSGRYTIGGFSVPSITMAAAVASSRNIR